MYRVCLAASACLAFTTLPAQSPFNISVSSAEAEAVMRGSYDPSAYAASEVVDDLDEIICSLEEDVNPDSLHRYIRIMQDFGTRNTYSDTVSPVRGIGAARRWAYDWFRSLDARREDRMVASYLDFEMPAAAFCGAGHFRNIFAVLPGRDATDPSVLFVEGHLDSRCDDVCDTACYAPGAEDNASGSALVMELARVMSRYTFDHTIVFLLTVGEEQGLFGAEAFADWCTDEGLLVKAVQNNDITGGVICGPSSSPPSCPGEGEIDSTSVRLFSAGSILNSKHKDYARFIKAVYREKVVSVSPVPMAVRIMAQEDRTGRGGDHIPFRENNFRAIRVCASHEHGDANTSNPGYEGRQHTSGDVLGVDTDGDGDLDSLFVDFNYLKRNTVLNGASLAAAALGPDFPSFTVTEGPTSVIVDIDDPAGYDHYRVGLRASEHDFAALYEVHDTTRFDVPGVGPTGYYSITVATVDSRGVPSLFAPEVNLINPGSDTGPVGGDTMAVGALDCHATGLAESPAGPAWPGVVLGSSPNPFSPGSLFWVEWALHESHGDAELQLHDDLGRKVWSRKLALTGGRNEVRYDGVEPAPGGYTLSLRIGGKTVRAIRLAARP